jgi:hypothetical protein
MYKTKVTLSGVARVGRHGRQAKHRQTLVQGSQGRLNSIKSVRLYVRWAFLYVRETLCLAEPATQPFAAEIRILMSNQRAYCQVNLFQFGLVAQD